MRLLPLGMIGTTDKIAVRFRQELNGLPIFGGTTNLLFDIEGRLLSFQSTALPDQSTALPEVLGLSVRPSIDARRAERAALADFEARYALDGAVASGPELGIAGIQVGKRRIATLVYEIEVLWSLPGVEAEDEIYRVDAHDGSVLERRPLIHQLDVGGTLMTMASPGTAPDTASNPPAAVPVHYARVTSAFGAVLSDVNGNFLIPGAPIGQSATFEYWGTYTDVEETGGMDHIFSQQLFGTTMTVTMNSAPTEIVTSQANAYQHIAKLRDWIRAVDPADDTANFQALARVNLQATCNAFFDGSSVNFFSAGGGCVNTAYASVVAHEMGHWLNVLYGTGNGNDGMGEGNADVFATYLYDTPILGEGFLGPGTMIRTGLNPAVAIDLRESIEFGPVGPDSIDDQASPRKSPVVRFARRQPIWLSRTKRAAGGFRGPPDVKRYCNIGVNTIMFCGDCCAGCNGGGVHTEGQAWMGAAWKLREHLNATHGNTLGDSIADLLFSSWMNGYDQTQIKSVIELQWLTLDDDNGNIDDGTPNYLDIDQGFRDQGYPGFDLPAILFEDPTILTDTIDESGPYVVDVTLIPQAAGLIAFAEIFYRVSGGPWQSVSMANIAGNDFRGMIPGQLSPSTIEYYISATDLAGTTETFPELGEEDPLLFHVGILHILFSDDFEGEDDNGWTHGSFGDTGNDHDDFQRGVSAGIAGDPEQAVSGEQLFGNDIGAGVANGLYQNNQHNWLRTPVVDAGAAVNTELEIHRWLTVENGMNDVARITIDGIEVWSNDLVDDTLDAQWVPQTFDISALADGHPALQVEFSLLTDDESVYGGWNLDDVELRFLAPVGGVVGTPFCFGDGSGTPCPCTNAAGSDEGCRNSSGVGALLTGGGSNSAVSDDLLFDAAQLLQNQPALLFSGLNATNGGDGILFGDGLRCAGGGVVRHGVRLPDGSGTANWGPGLGVQGGWQPGDARRFQVWYRDPVGGPCGNGFNRSSGVEVDFTN